jgi:hypothetical protein
VLKRRPKQSAGTVSESSSEAPPPLPSGSILPYATPGVRRSAKVYLTTALAPVMALVMSAAFMVWFLRS